MVQTVFMNERSFSTSYSQNNLITKNISYLVSLGLPLGWMGKFWRKTKKTEIAKQFQFFK